MCRLLIGPRCRYLGTRHTCDSVRPTRSTGVRESGRGTALGARLAADSVTVSGSDQQSAVSSQRAESAVSGRRLRSARTRQWPGRAQPAGGRLGGGSAAVKAEPAVADTMARPGPGSGAEQRRQLAERAPVHVAHAAAAGRRRPPPAAATRRRRPHTAPIDDTVAGSAQRNRTRGMWLNQQPGRGTTPFDIRQGIVPSIQPDMAV